MKSRKKKISLHVITFDAKQFGIVVFSIQEKITTTMNLVHSENIDVEITLFHHVLAKWCCNAHL